MALTETQAGERDVIALLARLGEALASTERFGEFFDSAVRMVAEMLRVEGCSIFILDPADNLLRLKSASRIPRNEWDAIGIPIGQGIVGRVAQTGVFCWAQHQKELEAARGEPLLPRYKTDSFISMPIRLQNRVIGVVNVDTKANGEVFTEDDAGLLKSLAGLLASALSASQLLEEQAKTNQHFDSILQSVRMGVMAFDKNRRMTHCNRKAAEMLSLGPDQTREGAPAEKVFPRTVRARVTELMEKLRRTGEPAEGEVDFVCEVRGRVKPLGLSVSLIEESDQSAAGVIVVIEDLTLRREMSELRRISELKSQFLSMMSHELRTPLTAIQGSVHLLKKCKDIEVDEASRRALDIVHRNAVRLTGVLNNILEVQSLEAKGVILERREVDLPDLLRERLDKRSELWAEKGVNATVSVLGDAPRKIWVDKERVAQAIDHLLDNAFKFCNPGGRVQARYEGDRRTVKIWVYNSGPPVPEDKRESIFEKFTQAEPAMTRQAGGCGLGLYLARTLMRLHNGDVTLENSDEEGTIFLAQLPAVHSPQTDPRRDAHIERRGENAQADSDRR